MNLAAYAGLAVRLVNSATEPAGDDPLRCAVALRAWLADLPFPAGPVTSQDLSRLRTLRADFAAVFQMAAAGDVTEVTDRLNTLMMVHPVHPILVSHDGEPWHLHLADSGSLTDRYAAAAVISLAVLVDESGTGRLGVCAITACDRVFIDGSNNHSRRYCPGHSAARGHLTVIRRPSRAVTAGTGHPPATAAS